MSGSSIKSFGKSDKMNSVNCDVLNNVDMPKHNDSKSDKGPRDMDGKKSELKQRHSSDSKVREKSLNRSRYSFRTDSEERRKASLNKSDAEIHKSGVSKREGSGLHGSTETIHRSTSMDKNGQKNNVRNTSNDRIRKRQESPRLGYESKNRRQQDSPRNWSLERSRRGQAFRRNASNERTHRGNFSRERNGRGAESPRASALIQKAPKGIDTSLALGDLEDSDDEEENVSPRKASPRKEIGSGLLQTTKSFEAKTALVRRQGSDSSLSKYGHKQSSNDRNEAVPKPFIKKSLSNPLRIDFTRKPSTSEDDDNGKTPSNELSEVKPVLDKSTHRSSGRKLPTPNEHLRTFPKSTTSTTADDHEGLEQKNTSAVETDALLDKSSQTDTYKTVDFNHTSDVPPSPRDSKRPLKRSASIEGALGHHVPESIVGAKKPPSPRDTRSTKAALEKKAVTRSASVSAIPSSPRGTTLPSPRSSKPPSPRAAKPPSPRNVSRGTVPSPRGSTVPSPRGSRVPSPRGSTVPSPRGTYRHNELVRKSSLERQTNSDKGLIRRNSGGSVESKEIVKRTSSGTLGHFKSPRSSSPTKSAKKFSQKAKENFIVEVNGIDNCMDLQALLLQVKESTNKSEETVQVNDYIHRFRSISKLFMCLISPKINETFLG